ncbi:zinc knuckle CX2CX4HX4C containing protein [Tanacetum coccineum]
MGDKRGKLKGSIGNEKLDVLSGLMDQRGVDIVRESTATRVNLDESSATCDGNPKVISSPLVSLSATLIMPPRGPYDIIVAATFGVPLTTVGDLHMLINDIETGKHDELLSEMTNDDRMETLDALVKAPNDPNADDNMPAAGASAKDQPKVKFNFRPLVADPIFDGVNISIPCKVVEKVSTRFEHTLYGYFIGKRMAFPIVEYYARNNWAKHGLKMIMMNNKGFFFFKFDSHAGLEAVLEGAPWLIYVVSIGIPSLIGEDFTKETIYVKYEWRPPKCDVCKIFGHVHDQCPKKVVTPPIIFTYPIVIPTVEKTNDGFQTMGKKKKRKDNITSSNSFSALNVEKEDEEEEVENVYDETANLFTKSGRSSFMAAAG